MCPRDVPAPALRLLALGALLWPSAGAWELTILHTNDVHSRLEQINQEGSSKCVNASLCVGGVARLFTKVQQIRQAEQNVLLLDAGDQYQGTIWFMVYKGAEVAHFMNLLSYDAMALGNHEFDNGVKGLIDPLLKEAKFPILSANIKAKGSLASEISGLYLPYKILNVGNEVVGIVGYTSKETPFLSNPGTDLVFEDEITALQPEVDKLKTLNVNKIIALGHSGFETDKLIAQKVKGVDVVVGGHSNTFLYTERSREWDITIDNIHFLLEKCWCLQCLCPLVIQLEGAGVCCFGHRGMAGVTSSCDTPACLR
uniref:5'-nucleotidase n=1 Tax=Oryctolagus cuniculus TaxID=9986 RepID=A0A5F9C7L5_RABIT